MKKTVLLAFTIMLLWGCNQEQQATQQEPDSTAEVAATGTTYGAGFKEENVMSVANLQEAVQEKDSVQAVVEGQIASSCQSKGCWMDVKLADNSTMKVTFKDYSFFLPVEDLTGKTVVFSGSAKREFISVDDQRHFAEDAGKTKEEIAAITEPKEELRFVADGVILK